MTEEYSSIQRLTLAGMVIGCLMVVTGAVSPFWIISDPQGFGKIISVLSKVVKGHLGLFMVCLEALGETECTSISSSDSGSGWFHSARVGASGCVLLSMVCAAVSCCLVCCNCCRRFIVLGLTSFVAALCGAYCLIVFSKNTESFTGSVLGFQITSYGWAYYLFMGGVATMGVVSFSACFSAPNNPLRGVVLRNPVAGGSQVVVATSSTHTVGHHPYMHLQETAAPPVAAPYTTTNAAVVTTNGY